GQGKGLERQNHQLSETVEEHARAREAWKGQAVKLRRAERALQERLRAVEAREQELAKRDSVTKKRETALDKREKAVEAERAGLVNRTEATGAGSEDLKARRDEMEREYATKRAALERRVRELE